MDSCKKIFPSGFLVPLPSWVLRRDFSPGICNDGSTWRTPEERHKIVKMLRLWQLDFISQSRCYHLRWKLWIRNWGYRWFICRPFHHKRIGSVMNKASHTRTTPPPTSLPTTGGIKCYWYSSPISTTHLVVGLQSFGAVLSAEDAQLGARRFARLTAIHPDRSTRF